MIICAPTEPAKSAARERLVERLAADRVVRRREPALAEARIQMRARGDGVDAVPAERAADLVEVLLGQLLRVVELVVVDQVAEAGDGPAATLSAVDSPLCWAGSRRGRSA